MSEFTIGRACFAAKNRQEGMFCHVIIIQQKQKQIENYIKFFKFKPIKDNCEGKLLMLAPSIGRKLVKLNKP